ncbi:hypothetical protein V6N12_000451 [Hibiscus sabdariffa]|uniref:Uncharacterized protein n=1 Tax=Hibiscus sabdariffa TaxID=183260 RepID=A0ABR2AF25_9ROSI
MDDRIRQLEYSVQKEKKVAQDFADSFDEVWRNHEDAIKGLEVQEVAQHLQVLAHEATELHECVGKETEEEQRLIWVLDEIRKLGGRVMPYA